MSTRSARATRGVVFAAVATLTAAAAHTLAGGGAPSPLFCVLLAALGAPPATALAGARPALWRTGAAVATAQLLFHGAFAVTGDIGAWRGAAAHVHGVGAWIPGATAAAASAPSVAMLAGHLLAAAATALAVHRGERALQAIRRWLPQVLPRIGGFRARRPLPRLRAIPVDTAPHRGARPLAGAVARRGPPISLSLPQPA